MKKVLIITNIITLAILLAITVRHFRFEWKKKNQLQLKTQEKIQISKKSPCEYLLDYFDFHYKKETQDPKIIMLGNSLIRHGNWDTLLGRKDVINRGISGDRLPCICERLKYLKNSPSKIIFIEGGINDLPGNCTDTLFHYFTEIVKFWQSENKIPVINLVLYISPKAGITFPSRNNYQSINDSVYELDKKLRSFAKENKIDFVDLNKKVSDTTHDLLFDKFTTDGVHLKGSAYKLWSEEIKNILKKHKI